MSRPSKRLRLNEEFAHQHSSSNDENDRLLTPSIQEPEELTSISPEGPATAFVEYGAAEAISQEAYEALTQPSSPHNDEEGNTTDSSIYNASTQEFGSSPHDSQETGTEINTEIISSGYGPSRHPSGAVAAQVAGPTNHHFFHP